MGIFFAQTTQNLKLEASVQAEGRIGRGSWAGQLDRVGKYGTADVIWGNKHKVEEKKENNVSTKEKDREDEEIEVKRLK